MTIKEIVSDQILSMLLTLEPRDRAEVIEDIKSNEHFCPDCGNNYDPLYRQICHCRNDD